jgi:protein-disulfide isomerase
MLPLAYHELARPAAEAALVAHAAGKFWPFHDRLMGLAADELSLERIRRAAAELGLDLGRSEDGLTGGTAANAVDRDLADARAAGIDATPTTLINGRLFSGMVGLERLLEICEQLLGATR